MQLSANFAFTDKLSAGASFTGIIDPRTQEHLRNEGFAGVKCGNYVIGFDDFYKSNDIIFTFEFGAYIGVGGQVNFSFNISEFYRDLKAWIKE